MPANLPAETMSQRLYEQPKPPMPYLIPLQPEQEPDNDKNENGDDGNEKGRPSSVMTIKAKQRQGSGAGCWARRGEGTRPAVRQGRAHDLCKSGGVHRDQPLAGPSARKGVEGGGGLAGRVAGIGGAQFVRAGHKG